jgi:hypothetical protein
MKKPATALAVLAAVTALGPAAAPAHAKGKTIHVTAEVTKSFQSRGAPTRRVALDFLSSRGRRVGGTVSALTCSGTSSSVGCFGGPLTLNGVGFRFLIDQTFWNVPLCSTGRRCSAGDRSTTGEVLKGRSVLRAKRAGSITFHTTSAGFSRLHHRFSVTVHID